MNKRLNILGKHIPVWLLILTLISAGAGAAAGTVLRGEVIGEMPVTVSQALLVGKPVAVPNDPDWTDNMPPVVKVVRQTLYPTVGHVAPDRWIGTVSDDQTAFQFAAEVDTGDRFLIALPLKNASGYDMVVELTLIYPDGLFVEVFGSNEEINPPPPIPSFPVSLPTITVPPIVVSPISVPSFTMTVPPITVPAIPLPPIPPPPITMPPITVSTIIIVPAIPITAVADIAAGTIISVPYFTITPPSTPPFFLTVLPGGVSFAVGVPITVPTISAPAPPLHLITVPSFTISVVFSVTVPPNPLPYPVNIIVPTIPMPTITVPAIPITAVDDIAAGTTITVPSFSITLPTISISVPTIVPPPDHTQNVTRTGLYTWKFILKKDAKKRAYNTDGYQWSDNIGILVAVADDAKPGFYRIEGKLKQVAY